MKLVIFFFSWILSLQANATELVIPDNYNDYYNISEKQNIEVSKYYKDDSNSCLSSAQSLRGRPSSIRDAYVQTNEKSKFQMGPALESRSQIKSAIIKDGELIVQIETISKFNQYEAPLNIRLEERVYEANPISTVLANTLLLGLPILFDPKNQGLSAIGCVDKKFNGYSIDVKSKTVTRVSEWVSDNKLNELVLVGLDKEYTFSSYGSNSESEIKESLHSSLIDQNNKEDEVELSLICKTCYDKGSFKDGISDPSVSQIKISYNIKEYKNDQLKKDKAQKVEDEKNLREQERAERERKTYEQANALREQQRKQEEAKLKAQKENEILENPKKQKIDAINKAKSNCAALGFDKDSPKFRACVLELIK